MARRTGNSALLIGVISAASLLAQETATPGVLYTSGTAFPCAEKDLRLQMAVPVLLELTGNVRPIALHRGTVVGASARRIRGVLMHPATSSPLASKTLVLTAYCRVVEESLAKVESYPDECRDKSRYAAITATRLTTETNQKGEFLFENLVPGSYVLFVQGPPFRTPPTPGRWAPGCNLPSGVAVTESPGTHPFLVFESKDAGESKVYTVWPNDSFELWPGR